MKKIINAIVTILIIIVLFCIAYMLYNLYDVEIKTRRETSELTSYALDKYGNEDTIYFDENNSKQEDNKETEKADNKELEKNDNSDNENNTMSDKEENQSKSSDPSSADERNENDGSTEQQTTNENHDSSITSDKKNDDEVCHGEIKGSDKKVDPSVLNKENEVVGYIQAPTLKMDGAVLVGDKEDKLQAALNTGVVIEPNSGLPKSGENMVIAGHREYDFNDLQYAKVGDPFIINIMGNNYTYEVSDIKVIGEEEVDKVFFDSATETVVLQTCYPFTYNSYVEGRYVVYLTPVDSIPANC